MPSEFDEDMNSNDEAEFEEYRKIGLEKGFLEVASGPMVRSSYRADRIFEKNNLDL